LKIGIDCRFVTRQPRRGIGNYSLNLVIALVKLDPTIEYILYIAEPDVEGILPNLSNVTVRQLWPSIYPIWENVALPFAAHNDQLDVLHCLGNTAPIFVSSRVRLVLSIMDVMFLQTGEFLPRPTTRYQKFGRLYRALLVPFVARLANKIITISEFSKKDILDLVSGVDEDQISVTHLSCDLIFLNESIGAGNSAGRIAETIHDPFVFCLGANDPRKNTVCLVRAYLRLLKQNNIPENLVISGYANWEKSESYRVVKEAGAESRVKFLDFITIDELAMLYRNAVVFVYPSLYEGFGIPILEAFSSGCPVIASNVTSIPEVGGDAALYFDPRSEDQIAKSLQSVLIDSALRETLKEKGRVRAKQFSWSETARKTLAVYKACLNESDK
jgi:glycosyltransferase involved in cell wall biosynthesis